jgi:hypothetical protein
LSGKRDFQRNRVYDWEDRVIAPHDSSFISFSDAQAMVNAIWSEIGLQYPPKVEPLPARAKATVASASRLSIFLPEQTPSWCLLHEIAHAMTSTMDGHSDGHGALFVGVYVRLISRYLRLDPAELIWSIELEDIQIESNALPTFSGAS